MIYKAGRVGQVYCLHDIENNICRIGKTDSGKLGSRQAQQVAYSAFELKIYSEDVPNAICFEYWLHNNFKSKNKRADWYYITPAEFCQSVELGRKLYKNLEMINYDENKRIKDLYEKMQQCNASLKPKKKLGRVYFDGLECKFEKY